MWIDIAVVVGYFMIILGVGLWIGRSVKHVDDYTVGNKQYRAPNDLRPCLLLSLEVALRWD